MALCCEMLATTYGEEFRLSREKHMSLTLMSDSLRDHCRKTRYSWFAAMVAAIVALFSVPLHAQQNVDDDLLKTLKDNGAITQEQYEALKKKYETQPAGATPTEPKTAEEAKPAGGEEKAGGVKLKVGGFIEGAGIYRSRNETADVGSNYNTGIPLPSNPNYKIPEFRGSARQSRLSLLASGDANEKTALAAYFELDFLGAGTTSNSVESNSYVPRLRQAYATYARSDWGMYFLFGQSWSMLTQDKVDITPRQENIPLTIDAQYTVGFNWDRNMQLRAVKDWGNGFSLGLSLESPQAIVAADATPGTNCTTALCFSNPGGSLLNSGAQYTTDYAPDVILKGALDPGYGHYELYGLVRFYQDNVNGTNERTTSGGIGGSTILPLSGKKLEFQASFLWGTGIGRYGSAQLPDVTILPNGQLQPLPGLDWLVGLVARPDAIWDLYLYGGQERVSEASYGTFGYGNPGLTTGPCFAGGVFANCHADTSSVWQVQVGGWNKFYQGKAGMMEVGLSYSYLHRSTFEGTGGAPTTNDNIVMLSFRYYPFQPVPAAYLKP
jgi:hypothetical protein